MADARNCGLFEMCSGGEEEFGDETEGDKRGSRDRKRKKGESNSESEHEEGRYVVGMRAEGKVDGVFGNPQDVGKFIEKRVGNVKSVRINRSGTVIIECRDFDQSYRAVNIYSYGEIPVNTFYLGGEERKRRKGVISGVPLTVKPDIFKEVDDVWDAKRMSRYREGQREDTLSICLTFEGDHLPERIYVDYMTYRVRPFERGPIRCFCCQEYGHVAAVCRRGRRCGRCGKEKCNNEECKTEEPVCLHCKGNHYVGSAGCPVRKKEAMVNNVRVEKGVTYAEAVKTVDKNKTGERVDRPRRRPEHTNQREDQNVCLDKRQFLAFIAMVINCAIEIKGKSERIKMVLEAARRFLNIVDITGEDLDITLREGCAAQSQTTIGSEK